MRSDVAYRELIGRVVASKAQILGRAAFTKIADLPGLVVDVDGGRVTVEGDPFVVLTLVCDRYRAVTGLISDTTTKRIIHESKLLERFPGLDLPTELSASRGR
ncbi:MAG: hypothetical protein U0271_47070 [Polyangiaceae bacterium]